MPRYLNHKKTNRYTNEFKAKAVQLSLMAGVQGQAVAKTLDIHPFMLSRWRKEYREGKFVADRRVKKVVDDGVVSEAARLKALEQENAKLRLENELLKKAIRFS